jgi:outer membrane protease
MNLNKIKLGIIFDETFELNASYSGSNNNSYKSELIDRDWLGENGGGDDGNTQYNNSTHYSKSIVKTNIAEFDIHTKTYIFKTISLNAGYRQQEFDFEDKTQNYIYSCDSFIQKNNTCVTGLRNISGNFNNVNHINYYQKFRIPYIGLGFRDNFFNNKLDLELFGAYSNAVFANDRDHHVARSRITTSKFYNGKYYNFGGNLGYNFYKNLTIKIGYEYSEIPLIKGNFTVKYHYPSIESSYLI